MDDTISQLLKKNIELLSGTYKPMSNKAKLDEYNKGLEKFKSLYNNKKSHTIISNMYNRL